MRRGPVGMTTYGIDVARHPETRKRLYASKPTITSRFSRRAVVRPMRSNMRGRSAAVRLTTAWTAPGPGDGISSVELLAVGVVHTS